MTAAAGARAGPSLSRRDFVAAGSCALACLALPGCASLVAHHVSPVNGAVMIETARYPELLGTHGAIRLQPDGFADPIYVLVAGAGEYRALSPICTHKGCTVEVEGARLVCPCHGSTYDRSGAVLKGPAERALLSYPVRQSAPGRIVIELRSAP